MKTPGGIQLEKKIKKNIIKGLETVKATLFVEIIKITGSIAESQYARMCRMVQLETLSHASFLNCIH
jgi:hypothetical protein